MMHRLFWSTIVASLTAFGVYLSFSYSQSLNSSILNDAFIRKTVREEMIEVYKEVEERDNSYATYKGSNSEDNMIPSINEPGDLDYSQLVEYLHTTMLLDYIIFFLIIILFIIIFDRHIKSIGVEILKSKLTKNSSNTNLQWFISVLEKSLNLNKTFVLCLYIFISISIITLFLFKFFIIKIILTNMDHFAYEHFYSLINKKDNSILLLLIINKYKNKNSYLTLQPMYYTRMFSRYFHTNIRSRKYNYKKI